MSTETGRSFPAANVPIYLIPATPYTQWYINLHAQEFRDAIKRAATIHHGGIAGMQERAIWSKVGRSGPPDLTKPIPFTDMDDSVFKTARTVGTDARGRYRFTAVPAGGYFVLTHWPIAIDKTSAETSGFITGFDGVGVEQSHTDVETDEYHFLMMFALTKPLHVTAGDNVKAHPGADNAQMMFDRCGLRPCAAYRIDQWLAPEDRL
jgi:hypothetical protein